MEGGTHQCSSSLSIPGRRVGENCGGSSDRPAAPSTGGEGLPPPSALRWGEEAGNIPSGKLDRPSQREG